MNLREFFKNHFRPKLTFAAILIAIAMIVAAKWQWRRYHEKLELVATYDTHSESAPIPLAATPSNELSDEQINNYAYKVVTLDGAYDFDNQVMVINRRHALGHGQWLLTPLRSKDLPKPVLVSRGFVPYEERHFSDIEKYSIQNSKSVSGVLKKSVPKRSTLSPSAETNTDKHFLYPDLPLIQKAFPYPIETRYFIQSIEDPVLDGLPAKDISIDVPPSTHFWYTFEWIGLSILTLLICFLIQLFRPLNRRRRPHPNANGQSK